MRKEATNRQSADKADRPALRTGSTAGRMRNPETVKMELKALEHLMERRLEWLGNPINRQRTTYEAVAADTRHLEREIDFLKTELSTTDKTRREEKI